MTEREKMLAGQLYDCGDPELLTRWNQAKDLVRDYNATDSADLEAKDRILGELLGGRGKNLWITALVKDSPGSTCPPGKQIPGQEGSSRSSTRMFPWLS